MADFHQNGAVATLHNLRTRTPEDLERELITITGRQKVTLILPSLYSELEGPALPAILDELNTVKFVHHVVIGLDRATRKEYKAARKFFDRLELPHSVLWNDGPRLRAIDERLASAGLSPTEPGKGRNVWYCIGYTLARAESDVIALHDCDILTYSKEMLARLVYPVANPEFAYQFCKGYYPRTADGKMNGRVSRLLVAPLLEAMRKTIGERDYLDYLRSFRYPLAGEFAMRTSILPAMRIPSDWGLEIGTLSEAWRNLAPRAVCQVEISDAYDHKHQPLSEDDAKKGLSRMSTDICKALYRKLATDGTVFSKETFRALKASYYRTALDFVEAYYNDARMNGLHVDRHKEERAVELFAGNIVDAGKTFLDNPMETPFIPAWSRVQAADPDLVRDLFEAVQADDEEFG
ncbi:MAG: glycosyl transferase [Roseitalea sp.]|uniref:Glycosyl transferase n=1 Tax=Oceaniradius stylonematis TaxID=2184161 RepID=A0A3A8AJ19_9HYPH|nr:glycosyl transferase [Oceaniradius stylonematis]MBO6551535.1 glycosyl transferase [Roseitalea sp.]MBO6952085.1 glycosyl transferase [Rhizobiaceae bacterium]RNC95515.1 MAG: glycosyl transferase [Oricola sp.]MBO6592069.1 glycosyl transferase [Roseitalea sp.]MBO6598324.1 glycosyl transferase [Roseitalea sp.]